MSYFKIVSYKIFCSICFLFFINIKQVSAAPVIDQISAEDWTAGVGIMSSIYWQQSVTVGKSGQLVGLEIYKFDDAPTLASLFINNGDGWQSDVNDYSAVITLNDHWGYEYFDLSSAELYYAAGDKFNFGFRGIGTDYSSINASNLNSYEDGGLYMYGVLFNNGMWDISFTTYMNDSDQQLPISEPSTAIIFGEALIALAFWRKRKTKNILNQK